MSIWSLLSWGASRSSVLAEAARQGRGEVGLARVLGDGPAQELHCLFVLAQRDQRRGVADRELGVPTNVQALAAELDGLITPALVQEQVGQHQPRLMVLWVLGKN